MSVWASIGGAICVAVTALGLVWSWRIWRRNGASKGMRAVAWSLLPLAAYLTSAVGLLGRLVNAVVIFAGAFVFSPKTWAGAIVVLIAILLFMASGGIPLVNRRKRKKDRRKGGDSGPAAVPAGHESTGTGNAVEARKPAGKKAAVPGGGDDDMSDIEEILRRRGIS
jgi:hypothetical protein